MKSITLTTALVAALAAILVAQNRDNDGKVHVQDQRQTLDRGRLGSQESMPPGPITLHGILVDAGCRDRSQLNLTRSSIPMVAAKPAETPQEAAEENAQRSKAGFATGKNDAGTSDGNAHGITVDQQTLAAEQADVLQHQVEDLVSRGDDPSCGITGRTSNFALLMNNGRLLNLDGGGNTWAWQSVQSSSAGQAMLNGNGPAVKPQVTIKGRIIGDRLIVDTLQRP